MKRIWKLGVCLLLISLMTVAFTACQQESVTEKEVRTLTQSGVKYIIVNKMDSDGTIIDTYAKVTGYNGANENIDIPSKVDEVPVKIIAARSFFMSDIKSIKINEGIETIESFAFGYAEDLISIDMPSTTKSIGSYAFINCLALKTVNLSATERPEMGNEAFKFYDKKDKEYKVNSLMTIYVPSIEAYTTSDVHDLWIEYQSNLKKEA